MQTMILYEMLGSAISYIAKNGIAFASLLVSCTALAITWFKNVRDRKRADDKELFGQLMFSLERAFASIVHAESGRPNKIAWAGWQELAGYREGYAPRKLLPRKQETNGKPTH